MLRFAGEIAYRTGLGPDPSDVPSYMRGPAPIRAALAWGWFEPRRFELQRT